MTDAPERIWAEDFKPTPNGKLHTVAGDYPLNSKSVEYIRADLSRPVTVAEAAKVLLDHDLLQYDAEIMDAVYETDDGLWVDEDCGACVSSDAMINGFRAALRALSHEGGE